MHTYISTYSFNSFKTRSFVNSKRYKNVRLVFVHIFRHCDGTIIIILIRTFDLIAFGVLFWWIRYTYSSERNRTNVCENVFVFMWKRTIHRKKWKGIEIFDTTNCWALNSKWTQLQIQSDLGGLIVVHSDIFFYSILFCCHSLSLFATEEYPMSIRSFWY